MEDGSLTDLTVLLKSHTTAAQVNRAFEEAAYGRFKLEFKGSSRRRQAP